MAHDKKTYDKWYIYLITVPFPRGLLEDKKTYNTTVYIRSSIIQICYMMSKGTIQSAMLRHHEIYPRTVPASSITLAVAFQIPLLHHFTILFKPYIHELEKNTLTALQNHLPIHSSWRKIQNLPANIQDPFKILLPTTAMLRTASGVIRQSQSK